MSREGQGLLIGADAQVATWAFQTYRLIPTHYNQAIGVINPEEGILKAAIIFQAFNGSDLTLSYYGEQTLTPGIIRSIALAVVNTFNANRLSVVTPKTNRRLIRALMRLGFIQEGAARRYYGPLDTAQCTGIRLVMYRERLEQIARLIPPRKELH